MHLDILCLIIPITKQNSVENQLTQGTNQFLILLIEQKKKWYGEKDETKFGRASVSGKKRLQI